MLFSSNPNIYTDLRGMYLHVDCMSKSKYLIIEYFNNIPINEMTKITQIMEET